MARNRPVTFLRRVCVVALGLIVIGWNLDVADANDDRTIARLKSVQQKTETLVIRNLPACVAVSDGVGFGSGVIVSPEGLVLTAGHVMGSDGDYEVILPSGRTVKAKPLGKNLNDDAGMVQIIEKGPWPYVEMSRDRSNRNGDWIVSLGHSGGFELGRSPPVRTGRILSQNQKEFLTDAVLIGGDSGGPLFNLKGQLIGIHSSIGDTIAENRHVRLDIFFRDWDRLKKGDRWGSLRIKSDSVKRKKHGLIGVKVDLEASVCRIKSVEPGSAAKLVGIRAGDVVSRIDEIKIRDGQHLIDFVRNKRQGDSVMLSVQRNGTTLGFRLTLR